MTSKDLIITFARLWQQKVGQPYAISWTKECAQLKRLLKFHSAETLDRYLRFYLTEWSDPFAKQAGFSFGVFISQLPKLVLSAEEARAKRERAAAPSGDFQRLEEARRRLGE